MQADRWRDFRDEFEELARNNSESWSRSEKDSEMPIALADPDFDSDSKGAFLRNGY